MHSRVARLCASRHPTSTSTRGTHVIVVPGFMACDLSTALLRSYLRRRGHHALPWGFGRNVGPVDGLMQRLVDRIVAAADVAGEGVILVGHSLGGIYAREIAKTAPDAVRAVFTLGSPIHALSPQRREANAAILREIERASGRTVDDWRAQGWFGDLAASPPVRCVALYSKCDTVAPWQSCLGTPSRLLENVEVNVAHRRMVVSPTVFRAIGARMRRRPRGASTSLVA